MSTLRPLIDRFVEDVLRALRAASLSELMGRPEAREPEPPARAKPRRPRATPRVTRRGTPASAAPIHEPAPTGEITDPELLLRAAVAEREEEAPRIETPTPPPASTERPTAPARLRADETLLRASNAGVVVRRRRG